MRANSQTWIFTTYAYEHSSRSAIMTPQNLRSLTPKANGSLQKGERMSADEYTRLKRGHLAAFLSYAHPGDAPNLLGA